MLESKTVSDIGKKRERNEDACLCNVELGFWVLADGVGGNGFGHVASEIAVQSADRALRQGASVVDAVEAANSAIIFASKKNPDWQGMASTIVVCQFDDERFEVAWVGDSRAYYVSSESLRCLTKDHNLAAESGLDTRRAHHQLTQALGYLTLGRAPCVSGVLQPGDCLLICSDGLSGVLDDSFIHGAIIDAPSLDECAKLLLASVQDAGAPDNVSFSLIRNLSSSRSSAGPDSSLDEQNASFRSCFDSQRYVHKSRFRPYLLVLIIVSILFLIFVI